MALGKALGIFDRGGFDATANTFSSWGNHAFNSILGGVVIKGGDGVGGLTWNELQSTNGGALGHFSGANSGTNAIDAMFDQCDAYNNTNPVLFGTTIPYLWTLMMRVFAGENSPAYALALKGGPISVGANSTGCWWTTGASSYIKAWSDFMALLAAYIPNYTIRSATSSGGIGSGWPVANTHTLAGHPLLGQVILSPTMTKFAETMLKDDFNGGTNGWSPANSSLPVPYTYALDGAALSGTFTPMGTTWSPTPISLAHNPYLEITATGTNKHESTGATNTEGLMTSFAGGTWLQYVVANNSLRDNVLTYPNPTTHLGYSDRNGDYTSMYTKMASLGKGQGCLDLGFTIGANPIPIEIQTSTYSGMGATVAHLLGTFDYGIWLGARCIEAPNDGGGYTNATLAQLAAKVPGMLNNDPGGTVVQSPWDLPRHYWPLRYRY